MILGQTFVSQYPAVPISSYAENRLSRPQFAVRRVIESVAFEGARRDRAEAKAAKAAFKSMDIIDAKFHLDFDGAHSPSIRRRLGDNGGSYLLAKHMRTLRLFVDAGSLDSAHSRAAIEQAASILRGGGTVAFPTETVYGLGANALDAAAVAKIFAAKQRPNWDPLIVHLADRSKLTAITAGATEDATRLMNAFWPGPLTLLLPRSGAIPDAVTAGRPLVGVRVPQHPVAHELLRAAGVPLAAPSANTFGRISPTQAQHVAEDLDGKIHAILDSGETTHGLESTVIDPWASPCIVYRPGVITMEQIRAVCPGAVAFQETPPGVSVEPESLPSPGVAVRHYAPKARLIVVDGADGNQRERFAAVLRSVSGTADRIGLMLPEGFDLEQDAFGALVYRWGAWTDEEKLAHRLFAGLRWLDSAGATVIVCPLPDAKGIGVAIRDRLKRAARK